MGRLAHSIHAKSAPQADRAGDKERCGLLCCVAQSLVPGMYRQRLPLIRTPWHHLTSYQSLVPSMYRQACRSYALLGTTSSAISSSAIVAVRIALKRSFCGLVTFEALLRNGRFFVFMPSFFCFHPVLGTRHSLAFCFHAVLFCFHPVRLTTLCFPCHPGQRPRPPTSNWHTSSACSRVPTQARPRCHSACTLGQTEAQRDMSLRTNLNGATQREEHAQAGVGAATPTSSSTACGRFCRADSAAGPPYSDAELVPHEEPRAFDPKIPDLAGACRRLPAARQVSAGTSRCLASGYTSVCALRSQLEPSRTRPPLWLRAFVSTEVGRCNALPRVSLYPSTVILGTGAPRIVVPFPACASPSM